MNPVRSYSDFQEYMKYMRPQYNKPIPIILIRPGILQSVIHFPELHGILDYFNHRTAEDIAFFLPGYSHYPNLAFAEKFPRFGGFNDEDSVFVYYDYHHRQDHRIQFSNKDFTEFINFLENNAGGFRYIGDTELLLATFIPGSEGQFGDLDFHTLSDHRYNLSKLVLLNNQRINGSGYRAVENFLEHVYQELKHYDEQHVDENSFNNRIQLIYYNVFCRGGNI